MLRILFSLKFWGRNLITKIQQRLLMHSDEYFGRHRVSWPKPKLKIIDYRVSILDNISPILTMADWFAIIPRLSITHNHRGASQPGASITGVQVHTSTMQASSLTINKTGHIILITTKS